MPAATEPAAPEPAAQWSWVIRRAAIRDQLTTRGGHTPLFANTPPPAEPAAPREVPSLEAVAGALRNPDLRGKISDTDRQQLLYLYNLANNR